MPSGYCTLRSLQVRVRFFPCQSGVAGIDCLVSPEVLYDSFAFPISDRAMPNGPSSGGALIGAKPG